LRLGPRPISRTSTKAVEDAKRAGTAAIQFVDGLTNAELVSKAEATEKQASAALAAVK